MFEVDPSFRTGMDVITEGDQPFAGALPNNSPDDWLLLGVKVARGHENDVWFVRLSSVAPMNQASAAAPRSKEFTVPFGMGGVKTGAKFTAPIGKLQVETFDRDGVLLRSSIRTVPRMASNATLLDVLGGIVAGGESGSELSASMPSVLTTMQLLGGSKALTPIREAIRDHIITKPSILAIILQGFRVKVEAKIDEREFVHSPWSEHAPLVPRQEAKFPVLLSGQHLFDCRVVVAPPTPPYYLTAGALLIEAVHPEKSSNRLTMCVLAGKHVGDAGPGDEKLPAVASRN